MRARVIYMLFYKYKKTWGMVIRGKITRPLPAPLPMIVRKSWLKILGVTFQENSSMWDMHLDELMSKACSRMYIIRICKYYGFSRKEVWGCASYSKYLSQVDQLLTERACI